MGAKQKWTFEPGVKIGRLTVVKWLGGGGNWECKCECGAVRIVKGTYLASGNTKSCGCLQRDSVRKRQTTHGMYGTPEYRSWTNMLNRCYYTPLPMYPLYGGRGIRVCDSWHDFSNFYTDMGDRPKGHTLDRIDSDGNYEPGNCRWATALEQGRNRRGTRSIEFAGKKMVLTEWCLMLGVPYDLVKSRLRRGYTFVEAVTTPRSERVLTNSNRRCNG